MNQNELLLRQALEAQRRFEADLKMGQERRRKQLLEPIDPSNEYADLLERLSKAELTEIRQNWDISGVSSLKKQELIEVLIRKIPALLNKWLELLNSEQTEFIRDVIEHDGVLPIQEFDVKLIEYYRLRGVLFSGTFEGESVVVLPLTLLEVCKAVVQDPAWYQRAVVIDELLTLTKGLLLYYGVQTYVDLLDETVSLIDNHSKVIQLDRFIYRDILMEFCKYDGSIKIYGSYFYSPDLNDPEAVVDEHQLRKRLPIYPVTYEMAKKAGTEGYIEWNKFQFAMRDFLHKTLVCSLDKANDLTRHMVLNILNDLSLQEQFDCIQNYINFKTFEQVQKLMGYLQEMNNNTRQWVIKGYTPNELHTEEKKHLRPLSTAAFVEEVRPTTSTVQKGKKTGRNELCPCGSGKKYKKCCGR